MAIFENLSERLAGSLKKISGKANLTEENIQETLREVRMALLEADVALPVVKLFIESVKKRAIGQNVGKGLSPSQQFLKIVQSELERIMGESNEELNLAAQAPAVILVAGLQGAGKTTSVAKLANFLVKQKKKKVMVVSADIYRPAAIKQLEVLAGEVGVEFHPSQSSQNPSDIALSALKSAKIKFMDVLLVDTAGRLHVDSEMMTEIQLIHAAVEPIETLFVADAMIGQDAVVTAKAFNDTLPLTGVILTKVDGDARGGAALSVRHVTGKPIKFLGVGEKIDALEPFYPERIASRILGMGDVMSLIEDVEQKVDRKKAEKLAKKVSQGKKFDLNDLKDQLKQMKDMGGLSSMMDKLPGLGGMPKIAEKSGMAENFSRMEFIIDSMTPLERSKPDILNGSRKRRITQGSGTTLQDLNRLLKQHKQMGMMMKKMKGKGMQRMMQGLSGAAPKSNGGSFSGGNGKFPF
jgi:signal recognition particle subunit SRP54|tara:strand:- start:203 stop:1600 length:1398 start_codon:yes stop_codon:yes gene_type:complete